MKRLAYLALGIILGSALAAYAADNYRQSVPGGTTVTKRAVEVSTGVYSDGVVSTSDYPAGATPITASSANVANASAAATLAGVATKTTYICGFNITSAGSTAAAVVTPTISGTITGTMNFTYATIAGVTLMNPVLSQNMGGRCIPASAANTAIVVTLPALGAGNTNATVNAWGYQL